MYVLCGEGEKKEKRKEKRKERAGRSVLGLHIIILLFVLFYIISHRRQRSMKKKKEEIVEKLGAESVLPYGITYSHYILCTYKINMLKS